MIRGGLFKYIEDGLGGVGLTKVRLAVIAAYRNEMDVPAAIVFRREADVLAIDWHTIS